MDENDLLKINFTKKIKIKRKLYDFKTQANVWFKKITKLGFSPFPLYYSPTSSEIIRESRKFLKSARINHGLFLCN